MTTGYYLLDHPNPNGRHYYTVRAKRLIAQIIHITAGLEDIDLRGPDSTAEGEARYAATTSREVSWHSGSDTDSGIYLLPYQYTGFQCVNYNSSTAGHEISKLETNWKDDSPKVVEARLRQAAKTIRPKMVQFRIPFRKASKAEVDNAISRQSSPVGMIGHGELDPDRRTDPGTVMVGGKRIETFPWKQFIEILNDDVTPGEDLSIVDAATKEYLDRQFSLNMHGDSTHTGNLDNAVAKAEAAYNMAASAKQDTEKILELLNKTP